VGYYSAGYRVGGFFLLMASSVGIIFFPVFSKAIAEGRYSYIRDKILQFERFGYLFIMPLVIFLMLYSDVIVKILLGDQYMPAIPILSIITGATFIKVISDPYGNVLSGLGLFDLLMVLNIANLLIFAAAIPVLVSPSFMNLGARGIAFAILASNLFMSIVFRIFAKANCSAVELRYNLRYAVFGILNFLICGVFYSFGRNAYGTRFQIVFPILYFGMTYFLLMIFRWINMNDIRTLLTLVQLDKVLKYVRNEIRMKK
jgi:O-antigen/teichoic acid export membrane protein